MMITRIRWTMGKTGTGPRELMENMSHRTPQLPSWLPIDPYILALIGTVALAALAPARGGAAPVADGASTGAVALLSSSTACGSPPRRRWRG